MTFRLTAPDPDFLDKLAFEFTAPVPAYVPARDIGRDPVPGTGPYLITRYVPGRQVVFARNRYFREWSAAAQPGGSPDRIVWTFGTSLTREITQIETGQADWTDDTLPGVAGLSAQFPSQVHISPLPEIVYTAFNTRVAPFNDPAVRRAFSLAADRSRFATLLGGPGLAVPTCQILPPGIPGYQPYCPFSADASASATQIAPELATARGLVAASGTKGMRITVWSDDAPPDGTTGAFTVSVLRELGYRASLHIASHAAVVQAANDSRRRIQATNGVWYADYPSASDFFDLFFRCSAFRLDDPAATRNGSFYCDPAADQLMNLADSQQATDPGAGRRNMGRRRPGGHLRRPLGDAGQPEQRRLPVRPGHQLPVQPLPWRTARSAADTPGARPALTAPVRPRSTWRSRRCPRPTRRRHFGRRSYRRVDSSCWAGPAAEGGPDRRGPDLGGDNRVRRPRVQAYRAGHACL